MSGLSHEPGVEALGVAAYRPVCGCGWRSKELAPKERSALKIAQHHAAETGCGKTRFATRAAAEQAVLAAKVARSLRGNQRRREQRAYLCPDCPGDVWHLTSRPALSPSTVRSS